MSPPLSSFLAHQDRHGLELKVYKQRVKHLLYEHSGHVARLKVDGEAALKAQARPAAWLRPARVLLGHFGERN
jgi:hypothetical protein